LIGELSELSSCLYEIVEAICRAISVVRTPSFTIRPQYLSFPC
jgi:hypothetical protein